MKTVNHTIELPFPLMSYPVLAKYAEIKRASGVSYILMVLIDGGGQDKDTIADILSSFDIPSDLHAIFAQELCDLVQNKIVSMKKGVYNIDDILNWQASNFEFTPQGREMYQKGNYLTGETNQKKAKVLFDPIAKEYTNYGNQVASLPEEQKSILLEKWSKLIGAGISGLDEWIKNHQGKIGIKNGAQVTEIELSEDEISIMKSKADSSAFVTIENNTLNTIVTIEDEEKQAVFNDYYDYDILSQIIKSKYGYLHDENGVELSLACESIEDVDKFLFPNEIPYAFRKPNCSYFLNKEQVIPHVDDKKICFSKEDSEKIINLFDANCEAISINGYSAKKHYPALLSNEYGFKISVLAETEIKNEEYKRLLGLLYNNLLEKEISNRVLEQLCFVQDAMNETNMNYLVDYSKKHIAQYATDKDIVDFLSALYPSFSKNDEWKQYYKEVIAENYNISMRNLDIRDIQYFHVVYKNSIQHLFHTDTDYYCAIINRLLQSNSINKTMDAICKIGCKPEDFLSQLNVVPFYTQAVINNVEIDDTNSLAIDFNEFRTAFNDMKSLLNIDTPLEETEDYSFDIEKFFKLFATIERYYSRLKKYSHLAEDDYQTIGFYLSAFEQFNEEASIRKIADNSPEKLSVTEIEKLINSGEYNRVIEILYYKVQLFLSNSLGKSGHLGQMIATAFSKGIISLDEKNELNNFKDARNPLQHPNLPKVPFDANNLKAWMNLICNLH